MSRRTSGRRRLRRDVYKRQALISVRDLCAFESRNCVNGREHDREHGSEDVEAWRMHEVHGDLLDDNAQDVRTRCFRSVYAICREVFGRGSFTDILISGNICDNAS